MNKFLRFFIKLSIITMLFPAKILSLPSKYTYLFDKLGCVSTIKIKNLRFLFCIVFNLH